MKLELTETVWLDERGAVTLVELSECSGLTESELRDLVELGALEPLDANAADWNFGANCIVAHAPRTDCATTSSSIPRPRDRALAHRAGAELNPVQECTPAASQLKDDAHTACRF